MTVTRSKSVDVGGRLAHRAGDNSVLDDDVLLETCDETSPRPTMLLHVLLGRADEAVSHQAQPRSLPVGLCESIFLRLGFSVELRVLNRYRKWQLTNYTVAQNKRPPGCSFKFVIQQ